MRNLIYITLLTIITLTACSLDPDTDTWDYYEDWRKENVNWMAQQQELTNEDGTPYYTKVQADWDNGATSYVLMKFFNDTNITANNLSPLYSSTVDMKYIGRTYDDVAFDSSYLQTEPADSVMRIKVSSLIGGCIIGLQNMHIGDSCEILIPYEQAYIDQTVGTILPYSALKFNIKLVDIPGYVVDVD